jgi:iron-sulfur cluster assembly accessory protein
MVRLTERAARQVRTLLAGQPAGEAKGLRLFVEGGGCCGAQYGLAFDEPRVDDLGGESQGIRVLIDPASAEQLRGATIDFKDDPGESGFTISNPQVRPNCGCRHSTGG